MSIIVGIFDNELDLDRAVNQLADEGFQETVFDQGILAQEVRGDEAFLFAPGTGAHGRIGKLTPENREATVRAFKSHLEDDFHLPARVIEGYAHTFYHGGEFVIVKAAPRQAGRVEELLRDCRASRVNRHE